MTTQDKREMLEFNMRRGIENSHRHGLSWQAIEQIMLAVLEAVRAKMKAHEERDAYMAELRKKRTCSPKPKLDVLK